MKIVNKEDTTFALIEDISEYKSMKRMVDWYNQALIDSGYDQYQYKIKRKGKSVFVDRDIPKKSL